MKIDYGGGVTSQILSPCCNAELDAEIDMTDPPNITLFLICTKCKSAFVPKIELGPAIRHMVIDVTIPRM